MSAGLCVRLDGPKDPGGGSAAMAPKSPASERQRRTPTRMLHLATCLVAMADHARAKAAGIISPWLALVMFTLIPNPHRAENEAAAVREAMGKIDHAFEAGKMVTGAQTLPTLLSLSRQSPPYVRVFALGRVHDMCIAAYEFACERQVF